ncbi:MAG: hypothetical protein U0992_25260 [Planctomycetaceae bacterium]
MKVAEDEQRIVDGRHLGPSAGVYPTSPLCRSSRGLLWNPVGCCGTLFLHIGQS